MQEKILEHIKSHLKNSLPEHEFSEVIEYAVLPTGKLFRSQLVLALANDANKITDDHYTFASSIEFHHTYTLIHDDLPSMDNDDFRRGKATTHKKFNEYKAILAGDALLNLSFELISQIKSQQLKKLLRLYGELTGAKGLILGQIMDLDDADKSFEDICRIHELKTSNLIDLALRGSNLLMDHPYPKDRIQALGQSLGLVFQLLDDLTELAAAPSEHEKEINPFLKFEQHQVFAKLTEKVTTVHEILCDHELTDTKKIIDAYFIKMKNKISKNQQAISEYVQDLEQIYTLL